MINFYKVCVHYFIGYFIDEYSNGRFTVKLPSGISLDFTSLASAKRFIKRDFSICHSN